MIWSSKKYNPSTNKTTDCCFARSTEELGHFLDVLSRFSNFFFEKCSWSHEITVLFLRFVTEHQISSQFLARKKVEFSTEITFFQKKITFCWVIDFKFLSRIGQLYTKSEHNFQPISSTFSRFLEVLLNPVKTSDLHFPLLSFPPSLHTLSSFSNWFDKNREEKRTLQKMLLPKLQKLILDSKPWFSGSQRLSRNNRSN